jgi:hypothetical protein
VGVLVICVLVFTVFCIVCTVFLYCFVYLPPSDNSTAVSSSSNNNSNNNNNYYFFTPPFLTFVFRKFTLEMSTHFDSCTILPN